MALNLRIRELRTARGLTLEQLARSVGISVPHMSGVERGRKNLNNHLLERIGAALDVPPCALIDGDDVAAISDLIRRLGAGDRARVEAFAVALLKSRL